MRLAGRAAMAGRGTVLSRSGLRSSASSGMFPPWRADGRSGMMSDASAEPWTSADDDPEWGGEREDPRLRDEAFRRLFAAGRKPHGSGQTRNRRQGREPRVAA